MRKYIALLCVLFLVFLCGCSESSISNPTKSESAGEGEVLAFAVTTINSKKTGIGTIYLTEDALTTSNINPTTGKAFTKSEISKIKSSNYTAALDEGYVMGITTPEGLDGGINEYLEKETTTILSKFDPKSVYMDINSGSIYTKNGNKQTFLAEHCLTVIIEVNDDENNIGNIYYPIEYLSTDYVNPYTKTNFTEEEVTSMRDGLATWILYEGAHMMIEPYHTGSLWSYTSEEANLIASHKGAFTINPSSGEISDVASKQILIAGAKEISNIE